LEQKENEKNLPLFDTYIATLTKTIHLDIELKIEKDCGYHTQDLIKSANGYFSKLLSYFWLSLRLS